MKNKLLKRVIAFAMSVFLVAELGLPVYAEELQSEAEVTVCETCQAEPCACEAEEPVCETCGAEPCACEAEEPVCETCGEEPCACEAEEPVCETCGEEPCVCEGVVDEVVVPEITEYVAGTEGDALKVSVVLADASDLSDEAVLKANEVSMDAAQMAAVELMLQADELYAEKMTALDISFAVGEETDVQPLNPVAVQVLLPGVGVDSDVRVYHLGEDLLVEHLESTVNPETGMVEFTAAHFSVYVFVVTGVDPATVDVETAEIWEATLPALTGVYADDLAAVADSQLGYKQSEVNVVKDENDQVLGHYSRYGAWNETPYAEWNALFVKFCVNYAEIPEERFPVADDAAAWVEALRDEEVDLFVPATVSADEYEPMTGDLVFFDVDFDGAADRVAILAEVSEDGSLVVIEEAAGEVAKNAAASDDASILGYGMLPVLMEEEAVRYTGIYACKKEEHKHTYKCYDGTGSLVCGKSEHTHSDACLPPMENYYTNPINPDIDVTLFNYGSYINVGDDKSLQFGWHKTVKPGGGNENGRPYEGIDGPAMQTDGSVFTNYRLDSTGIWYSNKIWNFPTVERLLNKDGYPQIAAKQKIAQNKDTGEIVDVSLEYLFPKSGEALKTGASTNPLSDYSRLREDAVFTPGTGYNSNYESMRLEMEGDGGLFEKDENGYYTYSSAKQSAYFDQEQNRFLLSETLIGPSHDGTDIIYKTANYARNFLPFNKINFENTDQFYPFGDGWAYMTQYATDGSVAEDLADLWFGFSMEFDFFIPKDGIVNGEEMTFYFKGDDDIWVYIDDVLLLDIAGCHGAVNSWINFATGQIYDYNVGYSNGNSRQRYSTIKETFINALGEDYVNEHMAGQFTEEGGFVDYSKHTLKFFYTERGGNISYCELKFNMPQLPNGSLSVGKELESVDGRVPAFAADALNYDFRVLKADENGEATDEVFIPQGTAYDIVDAEDYAKVLGTGVVGPDGYFTLKSGQVALFKEVFRFGEYDSYVVEERIPGDVAGVYGAVEFTAGNKSVSTEVVTDEGESQEYLMYYTPKLAANQTQKVTFTNKVKVDATVPLRITKDVIGDAEALRQEKYQIEVMVGADENSLAPLREGTTYTVNEIEKQVVKAGIIEIGEDETAVLELLPGTYYKVEELVDTTYTYFASYDDKQSGHIDYDHPVAADVVVTNVYTSGVTKTANADLASGGVTEIGRTEGFVISANVPFIPVNMTDRTFWLQDILEGGSYVVAEAGEHAGKAAVTVSCGDAVETRYVAVEALDGKETFWLDLSGFITADNANAGEEITLEYEVVVKDAKVNNEVIMRVAGRASAGISGYADIYTGKLTLTKYEADDTDRTLADNAVLSGAQFAVYKLEDGVTYWATFDQDNELIEWVQEEADATLVVTGDDGKVTVQGVCPGTYYFKEVVAPKGYLLNENDVEVVLAEASGDAVTDFISAEGYMLDEVLEIQTGELVIEKTVDVYNGTFDGATFVFQVEATWLDPMAGEDAEAEKILSDVYAIRFTEAGTQSLVIGPLPVGTVAVVTEIYAGAGYEGDGSAREVTVIADADASRDPDLEPATARFTNTHNGGMNGGTGLVNTFTYADSGWSYKVAEDSMNRTGGNETNGNVRLLYLPVSNLFSEEEEEQDGEEQTTV